MIGDAILICPKIKIIAQVPTDVYIAHQTLPIEA